MENLIWEDYLGSYKCPLSLSLYDMIHNDGMPRQNTLLEMSAKNACFDGWWYFLSLQVKFMLRITEYSQCINDLLMSNNALKLKHQYIKYVFDI